MTEYIDTAHLALVATQAAMQAGNLLRKGFGSTYEINTKPGRHNYVTMYDHAAEAQIIKTIRHHFPSHHILAEESGLSEAENSPYTWVIDPLDGTLNFSNNIPLFVVSIGITYKKDVVAGVIYHPMLKELYVAEKGKGAYMNGTRLSVNSVNNLETAVLSTGMPSNIHEHANPYLASFTQIAKVGCAIRDIGSAALNLAYLSSGRVSAYWIDSLQPWDIAAGKLIVEEAGGTVSHYNGSPHSIFSEDSLLATNGHIHQSMVNLLNP